MRYVTVLGLPIVGYELNMQTRLKKAIAQTDPLPVVVLASYCAWEWCGEVCLPGPVDTTALR